MRGRVILFVVALGFLEGGGEDQVLMDGVRCTASPPPGVNIDGCS